MVFSHRISNNHLGDLDRLKRIILAAYESGSHAVKLQTFSANSLCLPNVHQNHQITTGPWAGQSYWSLYKSMEVPRYWALEARDFAESLGIPLFSSPFSPLDLEYLVDNGFDMVKVASGEFTYPELIDAIIKSGVNFMASTGFSGHEEMLWIQERLSDSVITLLWCLFNQKSNYPTDLSELDSPNFLFSVLIHHD